MPFPLRLQRGHIDDDPAARIGALAQAHHQGVARNTEVLHRTRQRKRIGRDDALIAHHIDKTFGVKVLGIDYCRIDIGKHLELARATHVIAITGCAIADDTLTTGAALVGKLHLTRLIRLNHGMLFSHAADPTVTLDAHAGCFLASVKPASVRNVATSAQRCAQSASALGAA